MKFEEMKQKSTISLPKILRFININKFISCLNSFCNKDIIFIFFSNSHNILPKNTRLILFCTNHVFMQNINDRFHAVVVCLDDFYILDTQIRKFYQTRQLPSTYNYREKKYTKKFFVLSNYVTSCFQN